MSPMFIHQSFGNVFIYDFVTVNLPDCGLTLAKVTEIFLKVIKLNLHVYYSLIGR